MKLIRPTDWSLDEATLGLLSDLDETAHQINDIRPLTPEVLRQVNEKLLGERVFSSNALEGSTLTLRETTLILQTGSILSGPQHREAQEALNLGASYRQIEQVLESAADCWNQAAFLDLHRTLITNVNDDIAGCYRHQEVMLPGATHQPPGAPLVFELMNQLYDILKKTDLPVSHPHPLQLAACGLGSLGDRPHSSVRGRQRADGSIVARLFVATRPADRRNHPPRRSPFVL